MSKKRVGIMGGTFNPIHLGHLILAENAYEELELDEVLFVPSGNPYMKEYGDVLDAKTRIDLVGEAIEDNSHFLITTFNERIQKAVSDHIISKEEAFIA